MADIDLINRDPNNLNKYVQIDFEDILAEPYGVQSPDCVWSISNKIFKGGLKFWYQCMSTIFGLFVACLWAFTFAEVAFTSVWCFTPCLRLLSLCLHPLKKILSIFLGSCMGPCVETCGLCFSRIHVTQSQSDPPKALDSF